MLGDPLESVGVRGIDRVGIDKVVSGWLMVRTTSGADADVGVGVVCDMMLEPLDPDIVWASYRDFGLRKNYHVHSQCSLCGV